MVTNKTTFSGGGPINASYAVSLGLTYQLVSVTLHLSAAPTISGYLTITLDAQAGPEYDTVLSKTDLAAGSTTDFVFQPDQPFYLTGGDALDVAYANANGLGYGLEMVVVGEV
jgi:hypothetical protein